MALAPAGAALAAAPVLATPSVQSLVLRPFANVVLVEPVGDPRRVILFATGRLENLQSSTAPVSELAQAGVLVIAFDVDAYRRGLSARKSRCQYLAADFENLSQTAQKRLRFQHYIAPEIAGDADGAAIAYVAAAQAPDGTFVRAMTLQRAAKPNIPATVCHINSYQTRLAQRNDAAGGTPWQDYRSVPSWRLALLTEPQPAAASVAASAKLPCAVSACSIGDLPVVEVPAGGTVSSALAKRFAIIVSGDGGWAGLDKDLAAGLAARGVPVAGLSSLKYFWQAKSAAVAAADVTRMIEYYARTWGRSTLTLVGYSFGADVVPAIVNLLDPAVRSRIHSVVLLEPSTSATFEVHVADWLPGRETPGAPLLPELAKLGDLPTLCLSGDEDTESICRQVRQNGFISQPIPGGHHFGGDYRRVTQLVTQFLDRD